MALPPFDVHGNLSVGRLIGRGADGPLFSIVPVTLAELHDRFVRGKSAQRARIWDGWMRHRQKLDQLPVPYATLVDGSFVTTKGEPKDVDVCILYEAEVVNGLPAGAASQWEALLDHGAAAAHHFMDLYHAPVYHFSNPRFAATTLPQVSYWTRVFGIDRLGRQKALAVVSGGGTP
ncbi:MAG: DUF6932 family protein [Phycisphaerales bacterium JB038]